MSDLKIEVGKELIESIVNAKVQAAIVAELQKNSADLIPKMVEAAVNEKVDSNGRRSQYSSENKYSFIEVLCKNAIQEAAKDGLKSWINNNQARITSALETEFKKQQKGIVKSFLDSVMNSASNRWNIRVNFEDPK